MLNDRRLARCMQQGDARAFAEFVDAYGGQVHHLVRRYVDNLADAEDVTQEIFCALHRGIGGFRGDSTLATWVYRIALNHCLKHCQRRKPDSQPFDALDLPDPHRGADPEGAATRSELAAQVRAALERLPEAQADVVVLCELHGLTYQECAATLGIPVGTVKSRLSTAFRRLRGLLSGYVIGDERPLQAEAAQEAAR